MRIISYLGLAVSFISLLGIPTGWKTFLFFVIGITIFVKSYLMHRGEKINIKENKNSSFKQNDYIPKRPTIEKKETAEENDFGGEGNNLFNDFQDEE